MSEVTREDREAAEAILADLCAPMTDLVLEDMAKHVSQIRLAAYAAGKADEQERCAVMLEVMQGLEAWLSDPRMNQWPYMEGPYFARDRINNLVKIRAAIAAATEGQGK